METRDNSDATLASYSSRVQCVVNLAGPSDLQPVLAPTAKDYADLAIPVRALMGDTASAVAPQATQRYAWASPIQHVDKASAPHLLLHGQKDPLVPVEQARRMDTKLRANGIASKLVIYPGQGHGFEGDAFMNAISELNRFLDHQLKGKPAN